MKYYNIFRGFSAIALGFALVHPGNVFAQSSNLLTNPGFESGTVYWENWGNATAGSGAYAGSRALVIGGTPAGGGRGQDVTSKVRPGQAYVLTAYARMAPQGSAVGWVGVKFFDSNGRTISQFAEPVRQTSYVKITVPFTVPATTAKTYVWGWRDGGTALAYMDDFTLQSASTGGTVGSTNGSGTSRPRARTCRCDCGLDLRCDRGLDLRCDRGLDLRCDCGLDLRCDCGLDLRSHDLRFDAARPPVRPRARPPVRLRARPPVRLRARPPVRLRLDLRLDHGLDLRFTRTSVVELAVTAPSPSQRRPSQRLRCLSALLTGRRSVQCQRASAPISRAIRRADATTSSIRRPETRATRTRAALPHR